MLKLLVECRSGDKLEIVIPVYNESARIGRLINYYKNVFDVVLLDGGSTDKTVEIAKTCGATIFERQGSSVFTEQYFAHYASHATLSGMSFYMFADEHVDRNLLMSLIPALTRAEVIIGNRIDWCYGQKVAWFTSLLPRGGGRNDILYNAQDLHNGLKFKDGVRIHSIDVQHFQIWDMRKFLGQAAQYAAVEIQKFYEGPYPILKFIKRFVVFELFFLPKRLWRQRQTPISFQCWQVLIAIVMPIVALLCLIEAKYLMTAAAQRDFYSKFYDDV